MNNPYKVGDVVRLKLDGPVMTVAGLGERNLDSGVVDTCILSWYGADGECHTAVVEAERLVEWGGGKE